MKSKNDATDSKDKKEHSAKTNQSKSLSILLHSPTSDILELDKP
jgi:hypothetical protein